MKEPKFYLTPEEMLQHPYEGICDRECLALATSDKEVPTYEGYLDYPWIDYIYKDHTITLPYGALDIDKIIVNILLNTGKVRWDHGRLVPVGE